jgi:hypothetical protein
LRQSRVCDDIQGTVREGMLKGNSAPRLSDNSARTAPRDRGILNSAAVPRILARMKSHLTTLTLAITVTLAAAAGAQAACKVEYKAKRDNPLELFYESTVISGPCTRAAARRKLQSNLAGRGLELLKVISVRDQ